MYTARCLNYRHRNTGVCTAVLYKYLLIVSLLLYLLPYSTTAQQPETSHAEQQLEGITEAAEDMVTEDDSYQQALQQYRRHPLNLNTADEEQLQELKLLTPLQLHSLLQYRLLLGPLMSIYEIQAIPGWDIATIAAVRPYVTVAALTQSPAAVLRLFRSGENSLLLRTSRSFPASKEYTADSAGHSTYSGSPQRLLLRWSHRYRQALQYGITAEKDAGEQLFKGSQRQGFDFYSAHLFFRGRGVVRAIALGDFTVNLGQGLIQWQSLAFKKSSAVLQVKRQSAILRPYQSAGEYNFYRGAGITGAAGKWQATLFASARNMDATRRKDSLLSEGSYVSALQSSGLHRTGGELAGKGMERLMTWGGNINWRQGNFSAGLNTVQHRFQLPVIKSSEPYNLFAFRSSRLAAYSMDFSYTYRNIHLFGEMAMSGNKAGATVNGLLLSVAARADLAILYRRFSSRFQSLYANAFSENTSPANESGWYAGVSIRPADQWRLDAYADVYRFPWLRYRANAPGAGTDYMVQATYKPGKTLEVYSRYRAETKALNDMSSPAVLAPAVPRLRQNWRTHINWQYNSHLLLRCRAEWVWYDRRGSTPEEGLLLYTDLIYRPLLKPYDITCRLQYFETEGYNSRLYAYENDVLYSYTIPPFYGKGTRVYCCLKYAIRSHITCWLRVSHTKYDDKSLINKQLQKNSPGYDNECKFQIMYNF